MSIAYDSSALGAANSTWNHTVTGSNTLLLVYVYDFPGNISSITYGGQSLTNFVNIGLADYLWYLLGASVGTNTITITGGSATKRGISVSYTGVAQTGFPDSSDGGNATTGNSITSSTTVVASNCWLVGLGGGRTFGGGMTTLVTNRTDRIKFSPLPYSADAEDNGLLAFDSNATVGTGSQSVTVTKSVGGTSPFTGDILVSIAPFVVPLTNLLSIL